MNKELLIHEVKSIIYQLDNSTWVDYGMTSEAYLDIINLKLKQLLNEGDKNE